MTIQKQIDIEIRVQVISISMHNAHVRIQKIFPRALGERGGGSEV